MADNPRPRSHQGAWPGWIAFAAVLLCVLGILNILEGLVALLQHQVTFIDGDSLVVVNLTGLGIVMVVFGALLTLAGLGLFTRNPVARIAAVIIVALHALTQIGSLGAYPVWSLLMITLDVIILFALTVHWTPREPIVAPLPPNGGVHRADRDQQSREPAFPMNQPHPTEARTGEYPAYQNPSQAAQPSQPGTTNTGPYPPGRPTNSPAHSAAPTSGHGAGAA